MQLPRSIILVSFIALFSIFTFFGTAVFASGSPQAVLLALLKQEWPKVASVQNLTPPSIWSYQLSPAFPCEWPAASSKKICYYGFASQMDPQLSDGLRIAAPWAKISITDIAQRTPKLGILSKKLKRSASKERVPYAKK